MEKFQALVNWKTALVYLELFLSTSLPCFSSWSPWHSWYWPWLNYIKMLAKPRWVPVSHTECWAKAELQVSSVSLILSVPSVLSLYQMLTVLVPQVQQRSQLETKFNDYYQPGQPVPPQRHTSLRGLRDTQVGKLSPFTFMVKHLRFAVKSLEWFGGKTRILAEIDKNPVMRCSITLAIS